MRASKRSNRAPSRHRSGSSSSCHCSGRFKTLSIGRACGRAEEAVIKLHGSSKEWPEVAGYRATTSRSATRCGASGRWVNRGHAAVVPGSSPGCRLGRCFAGTDWHRPSSSTPTSLTNTQLASKARWLQTPRRSDLTLGCWPGRARRRSPAGDWPVAHRSGSADPDAATDRDNCWVRWQVKRHASFTTKPGIQVVAGASGVLIGLYPGQRDHGWSASFSPNSKPWR